MPRVGLAGATPTGDPPRRFVHGVLGLRPAEDLEDPGPGPGYAAFRQQLQALGDIATVSLDCGNYTGLVWRGCDGAMLAVVPICGPEEELALSLSRDAASRGVYRELEDSGSWIRQSW